MGIRATHPLATLQAMKAQRKFAMLTAYDHPTAAAGRRVYPVDRRPLGNVIPGQPTTRSVPLDVMIVLGEAVRRAPGRVPGGRHAVCRDAAVATTPYCAAAVRERMRL